MYEIDELHHYPLYKEIMKKTKKFVNEGFHPYDVTKSAIVHRNYAICNLVKQFKAVKSIDLLCDTLFNT